MCKKIIRTFVKLFLVVFAVTNASGQQANFSFTPSPIPYHEFKKGQKDMKAGGTFLYMTGDIDDPSVSGEVSIIGGGGVFFYRNAFRDNIAFDMGGALVVADGEIGNAADMSLGILSIPVGLEFQPMKTPDYAVIIFGGWNLTWSYLRITAMDAGTEYEYDIRTALKGPRFGMQVSLKMENLVISPFIMLSKLAGDAKIIVKQDGVETFSGSTHVTADTARNIGLDIYYRPWDITLSSLLQMTGQSEYKTYFVTLSYHFNSGEPDESPAGKK